MEREKIKVRLGPEGERCWYTPDLVIYDKVTDRLVFCEIKGPFERDDARVKRMACAEWCKRFGIGFLFAKQTKEGIEWKWIT